MYKFIFLLLPFVSYGQSCEVCGSVELDGSAYPTGLTYLWTCTDGQTSTLQNPTLTVTQDMTCQLLVTDPLTGCTAVSETVIINNCDCQCNTPCISPVFNSNSGCLSIVSNGSSCSVVASNTVQWKDEYSAFSTYTSALCGCSVAEHLTIASVQTSINAGKFVLGAYGLSKCPTRCLNRVDYVFAQGSNITSFPACSQQSETIEITPAEFVAGGNTVRVYYQSNTPYGTVVTIAEFTYNGNGLSASNVTAQIISSGKIYKKIIAKRTVTYTDGCPPAECEIEFIPPQQQSCYVTGFINTINLGTPCSFQGYSASLINAVAPITYQWTYNGSNIAETTQFLCLSGRPDGTYCVNMVDSEGCSTQACKIKQSPCTVSVNISASVNTLTANVSGCGSSPTYLWQRQVSGTTWVDVGTSQTYNTLGIPGFYRVYVTCGSCVATAFRDFTIPCTANVTLTSNTTTIFASVSGCNSAPSILYNLQQLSGGVWIDVMSFSSASNNESFIVGSTPNTYRVIITCSGCSAVAQINFGGGNPCQGFDVVMSGPITGCTGSNLLYTASIVDGTAPFNREWKVNGVTVATTTNYTFNPTVPGTYNISLTLTDDNNCVTNDFIFVNITTCCSLVASMSESDEVCINTNYTFTASQTGGTAPFTYNWSSQLGTSSPVSQGTGISKIFNFSVPGLYVITVNITDNNGCTSQFSRVLIIVNCTDCTCQPQLTLNNNCELIMSFINTGCVNFTYQLQYSLTGTGWSSVYSGPATANIAYTVEANGFYRLVLFSLDCATSQTQNVFVNCYIAPCVNQPTLFFNGTSQEVCGAVPVTITGNTFGGSATITYLTDSGLGSIYPSSVNTSPFEFVYTPSNNDLGNTVTIVGTTNNPNGGLCNSASDTYNIIYKPYPNINITTVETTICTGSTLTLSATPSGGTWSVVSGPGSIVGAILTPSAVGTIIVQYSVTLSGCTSTQNKTIEVINPPTVNFTVALHNPAPGITLQDRFFSIDGITAHLTNASGSCSTGNCPGGCAQWYNMLGLNTIWDFKVTSTLPVTWSFEHIVPTQSPNCTLVSQNSSEIIFHVLGLNSSTGAVSPAIPCTVPLVDRPCAFCIISFIMRLRAFDECGNEVYNKLFVKYNNN